MRARRTAWAALVAAAALAGCTTTGVDAPAPPGTPRLGAVADRHRVGPQGEDCGELPAGAVQAWRTPPRLSGTAPYQFVFGTPSPSGLLAASLAAPPAATPYALIDPATSAVVRRIATVPAYASASAAWDGTALLYAHVMWPGGKGTGEVHLWDAATGTDRLIAHGDENGGVGGTVFLSPGYAVWSQGVGGVAQPTGVLLRRWVAYERATGRTFTAAEGPYDVSALAGSRLWLVGNGGRSAALSVVRLDVAETRTGQAPAKVTDGLAPGAQVAVAGGDLWFVRDGLLWRLSQDDGATPHPVAGVELPGFSRDLHGVGDLLELRSGGERADEARSYVGSARTGVFARIDPEPPARASTPPSAGSATKPSASQASDLTMNLSPEARWAIQSPRPLLDALTCPS
ncbi:MAG: hypothetical protein IPK37_12530 [Austwickia sp.]|jgi:hypothetical protein|nr:MAG: hypothetical protein IPK37_12530 [Austwickia sp.]